MRGINRLLRDTGGGTAILLAAALPVLIGSAALAVDVGAVQLETRRLQGMADDAAIAAAANIPAAQGQARAAVAGAGSPATIQVDVVTGSYSADPAVAAQARFTAQATGGNAARVTLTGQSPTYFGRIFGRSSIAIARSATAARVDYAAFSVGSRLASLNDGLINGYLSALTGGSIGLTLLDYRAIAAADIDLIAYLDALKVRARLTDLNYGAVLDTPVTGEQSIGALADVIGDATAAAGLRALASQMRGGSARLGTLIDAGPLSGQDSGGLGLVRVNALSLATMLAQLQSDRRQVELDIGTAVPGLGATTLTLAVGERAVQSPWIAITDHGTPIVRTAQARLRVDSRTAPALLPGLAGLASVHVPLFVELTSAEARLERLACGPQGDWVTIAARPSPGIVALAASETAGFDDFSQPVRLSRARLVDTLLVDVTGMATIDLGVAEPWQQVSFDRSDIANNTVRTVSSSTLATGVTTSLLQQADLRVDVAGLIGLDARKLTGAVAGQLQAVGPALDGIINLATGTLGVRYGEADVRVTGLRCGMPSLVG
ncbi:TadG family pilus assembly protein [Sphingomonas sp. CJ99]